MVHGNIIKRFRNKLYYLKIVTSVMVLSMIAVITMSMIFSSIYKKALMDSAAKEYLDSLSRVNISLENIIKQVDNIYTYLRINPYVSLFLNTNERDMNLAYKAQNEATQTKHLNSYVNSICLYNASLDFFLSSGYLPLQQAELDNFFRESAMNTDILVSRNIVALNMDGQSIISTKYKEFSKDNKLRNSMLINIDSALIQKDILNSLDGRTIIMNGDGSTLIPVQLEKTEDNKLIKFITENAVAKDMEKGVLKFGNDKNIQLITYVKSDLANWYIVNVRSYNAITQTIKNKEMFLYIICIAILVFFMFISFMVSTKLYSPIKRVTESLKKKTSYINDKDNSEFPLILNIVEETFNKMDELSLKNEESMILLKETALRNLIIMEANEVNDGKAINDYPLKISFENLILVVLQIDFLNFQNRNNINIIETIISSTVNEVLDKKFFCETVHMYQGEICILMTFKDNKTNSFEGLLQALEEVKAMIKKLTGTTATIGIGSVINSVTECNSAYRKAKEMIKYRFIFGINKVIYERYIEDNLVSGLVYPTELKEKLIVSLRLNRRDEFVETLDNVIELLSIHIYSDAMTVFIKLVLDCIEAMNELTGRVKRIGFAYEEFNSILTLQEAKGWLLNLYTEYQTVIEEIGNLKDNKYYKIIEDTKEYINEHYGDINLSVEMLAEKMGYSHKYFSRIFKEISGQYLSDYIRQIRIAKAKELLCQDEFKINDIVNMTGFVNSSYFYSTFKNDVGMTPTEYKKFYHKSE